MATTILGLNYRLRFDPADASTHEQTKQRALTAITQLAGLGRLLTALTAEEATEVPPQDWPPDLLRERYGEIQTGLRTYGQLVALLADQAYGAVDELTAAQGGE